MTRVVRVSGESMSPTLPPVRPAAHPAGRRAGVRAQRGDVVVLRRGALRMVKRVVGVPGDVVVLEAGRLFVDGESVDGRPRVPGASRADLAVPGRATSWRATTRPPRTTPASGPSPSSPVEAVDAVVVRRLRRPRAIAPASTRGTVASGDHASQPTQVIMRAAAVRAPARAVIRPDAAVNRMHSRGSTARRSTPTTSGPRTAPRCRPQVGRAEVAMVAAAAGAAVVDQPLQPVGIADRDRPPGADRESAPCAAMPRTRARG